MTGATERINTARQDLSDDVLQLILCWRIVTKSIPVVPGPFRMKRAMPTTQIASRSRGAIWNASYAYGLFLCRYSAIATTNDDLVRHLASASML
jgi:hypothetical protein